MNSISLNQIKVCTVQKYKENNDQIYVLRVRFPRASLKKQKLVDIFHFNQKNINLSTTFVKGHVGP